MNRKELGKKIHKQGQEGEAVFKEYCLSLSSTLLLTKLQEVNGQRPADFLWVDRVQGTCLVEVKSTFEYGGNIKKHQLLWLKTLSNNINCYYAFVVDGEVHLITVQEVIDSIKRGETRWEGNHS